MPPEVDPAQTPGEPHDLGEMEDAPALAEDVVLTLCENAWVDVEQDIPWLLVALALPEHPNHADAVQAVRHHWVDAPHPGANPDAYYRGLVLNPPPGYAVVKLAEGG